MNENVFGDLRAFIERARAEGDLVELEGADWNLEIGVLTVTLASLIRACLRMAKNFLTRPAGKCFSSR